MEKDAKMYEIGYFLSPLIPEEKLDGSVLALRKAIEDKGALIVSEEKARMQRLAYPIKKFDSAYFGFIKFMAEPEVFLDIKSVLDKNTDIVRFLAVISEKEETVRTMKRNMARKKVIAPVDLEQKEEIKPEEIDQKIEELIA